MTMVNVAGHGGDSRASRGLYERPIVVEPIREVIETRDEVIRAMVSDPQREAVEIVADGGGTLYVGEQVPTYAGTARIDTTGAQVGQVLTTDRDGVLRPASIRGDVTHWVDSVDDVPDSARPGDMVILLDGSGHVYEVVV